MKTISRKAAWVFRYFLERSFGRDGNGNYCSTHLEAAATYDDGMDFSVAFGDAFPGRSLDPNHRNASARLSAILRLLAADKWLERWRMGNQSDGLPGDPKWQYVYKLPQWLINDLKTGRLTPESAAEKWGG